MQKIILLLLALLLHFNLCSQCPTPVIALMDVNPTDAQVSTTIAGIIEYGPAGFTPGTGANPSPNGTLFNCFCSTPVITGLNPATYYDIYIRNDCGNPGGYSANSNVVHVLTPLCPITDTYTTLGTILNLTFGGKGFYQGYGAGWNGPDKGKERIVKFTPAVNGIYSIMRRSPVSSFFMGEFIYRVANGTCNFFEGSPAAGWMNETNNVLSYSWVGNTQYRVENFDIGPLTAGVTYDLSFDSNDTTDLYSQFPPVNLADISLTYGGCNVAPAAISRSSNSSCNGSPVTLTQYGGQFPGGGAFKWYTGSCGGTLTGTGNSIVVNPTVTTTYYVRAESSCGNSTCASVTITANGAALATPGTVTGPARVCPGATSVVFSIAPVANATTYQWTAPANAVIAAGNGTSSVTVNFTGSYTNGSLSVKAGNSCGYGAVRNKSIVRDIPGTPGAITGPVSNLCNGASATYSIPPTANATTYLWTVPAGVIINIGQGTTTIQVTFPAAYTTGVISVKAGSTCGYGGTRNLTAKGTAATPASITGPSSVCANQQNVVYNIAAVTGATSYTWTLPAGSAFASGQGTTSINMNFGMNAGNIRVRANNSCGSGAYKILAVAIVCRAGAGEHSFSVYPNPSGESFRLEMNENNANVSIYDCSGRLIESFTYNNEPVIFGEQLTSGLYIMKTIAGSVVRTSTLVKE